MRTQKSKTNIQAFNPFTARVLDGVLLGDSNYWVCWWSPMMWPFKWKLSACTFTWCYLFLKILENEIWKFGRNLPLATFGSETVKKLIEKAPHAVVQRVNSAIHRINHYPVDNAIDFPDTYPLDSDLSGG